MGSEEMDRWRRASDFRYQKLGTWCCLSQKEVYRKDPGWDGGGPIESLKKRVVLCSSPSIVFHLSITQRCMKQTALDTLREMPVSQRIFFNLIMKTILPMQHGGLDLLKKKNSAESFPQLTRIRHPV